MTQGLLHVGRVRAFGQQQRGVGVLQVVPPYVGQPRSLEQGLEVAGDDVLRFKPQIRAGILEGSLLDAPPSADQDGAERLALPS